MSIFINAGELLLDFCYQLLLVWFWLRIQRISDSLTSRTVLDHTFIFYRIQHLKRLSSHSYKDFTLTYWVERKIKMKGSSSPRSNSVIWESNLGNSAWQADVITTRLWYSNLYNEHQCYLKLFGYRIYKLSEVDIPRIKILPIKSSVVG